MNRKGLTMAALAGFCGLAAAPEAPRARVPSRRVVGQIVSTDVRARLLTVRTPAASEVSERATLTLGVSPRVAGQLRRYTSGDWVELTCAAPASATPTVPVGQASPGPAPVGTGARPGTGTTGVGTTGTGISGTGTPAPGTTPAAGDGDPPTAGTEPPPCGMVTQIGSAPPPPEPRRP